MRSVLSFTSVRGEKYDTLSLLGSFILSLFGGTSLSQIHSLPKWTINSDPFQTNVFVQNIGQFDFWMKNSPSTIKYAVNNGSGIFFTGQGVAYCLNEIVNIDEKEYEEAEHGEKSLPQTRSYIVNMNWVGCNTNATIEVSEPVQGYYTFGEKGYESVNVKGFKKLTYKNLYPGIDVEYIIPEKGGIKYSIIAQRGADISLVKMNYTGDVKKSITDHEGNVVIQTAAGDVIDHAPLSFYKYNKSNIPSSFQLKENTVSFILEALNFTDETIIVDPWTTVPFGGTIKPIDVDYDNFGNVFISGQGRIARYNSAGVLQYSYTLPAGWETVASSYRYSEPAIIRQSGTVVKGEGARLPPGLGGGPLRTLKLRLNGTMTGPYNLLNGTNEMWSIVYNNCTNKLYGFGGGTGTSYDGSNCQILDTAITPLISQNINNYSPSCCNDVVKVVQDNTGDAYALFVSVALNSPNNRIMKSLYPAYTSPQTWDVASGYTFVEVQTLNIITPPAAGAINTSCFFNALAVNQSYLYSYDGKTLKAWNKNTGAMLGSIVVDASYVATTYSGVAADVCNNIYVGGKNKVHMYTFNGSGFSTGTAITANITGDVYDVMVDQSNKILLTCGNGFLTSTSIAIGNCSKLDTVITTATAPCQASCTGTATVNILGNGTAPYTYSWSTGATTANISGSCGIYIVTVTDNSCPKIAQIDTVIIGGSMNGGISVTINSTGAPCLSNGGNVTATVFGGTAPFTYSWNNMQTGVTLTGLSSGTYTVTVTSSSGCTATAAATIVASSPIVGQFTKGTANCTGCGCKQWVMVNATGGTSPYTYLWPDGYVNRYKNQLCPGNYSINIKDKNGCSVNVSITAP